MLMDRLTQHEFDSVIRTTEENLKKAMVKRIVCAPCCKQCCLDTCINFENACQIVQLCQNEIRGLDRKHKKMYMLEKIRNCVAKKHEMSGYASFCWKIGVAPNQVLKNVCRKCFMNVYNVSHGYVEGIVRDIKEGTRNYMFSSNKTARVHSKFIKNLEQLASIHGIEMSREQVQAMKIPNTIVSLVAFAWLASYFAACGEPQPNGGEIHLDPCTVSHIFEEYVVVVSDSGERTLTYSHFLILWKECFPHVKVREYKNVTGKCVCCSNLSAAKREKLDLASRKYLNQLTSLHRSFYMGERIAYYSRRNDAMLTPSEYMSLISDGMQQGHCLLPWQANMHQFGNHLPQHLQGVLNHGRNIKIYRTFHNVRNNANLSIHCFLKALEAIHNDPNDKIPDVVYYQVDGGTENTATHVLAMAALVVARGLAKKVVITRLPVGHTHEDIDSKFAFIWKRVRTAFVLTPIQYAEAVETSLSNDRIRCEVIDVFVVPNYEKYISPYIIQDFGRYAKVSNTGVDWTQLQWIFEAVPLSECFPCEVKTTYRKFSADSVILIEQICPGDPHSSFSVKNVETVTYPLANGQYSAGFSMLTSLPPFDRTFEPDSFTLGSRALLDSVISKCRTHFRNNPDIVQQWEAFGSIAPADDSAQAYCDLNPLDIPLKHILFNNAERNREAAVPARERRVREKVVAADSVIFRRPGRQPSATPYVDAVADTITVLPAATNSIIEESSSDEDGQLKYQDVTHDDHVSGTESLDRYLGYVGRSFIDIDEDNEEFCIVSVCKALPVRGRRRRLNGLCFKYQHVNAPTEFEYTPCQELLNSTWCSWKSTTSASARQSRAKERVDSLNIPAKAHSVTRGKKLAESGKGLKRARLIDKDDEDEDYSSNMSVPSRRVTRSNQLTVGFTNCVQERVGHINSNNEADEEQ